MRDEAWGTENPALPRPNCSPTRIANLRSLELWQTTLTPPIILTPGDACGVPVVFLFGHGASFSEELVEVLAVPWGGAQSVKSDPGILWN